MAASKGPLISALVRLANQQDDPISYLTGLLTQAAQFVTTPDGRIRIGSSTGGSSASWTVFDGMTQADALEIIELALRIVETNVNATWDPNDPTATIPQICPVRNADRGITYPTFSTIAR